MPEIKISKKQKTAKERLRDVQESQQAKKKKGKKLTVAELEDRLIEIENIILSDNWSRKK